MRLPSAGYSAAMIDCSEFGKASELHQREAQKLQGVTADESSDCLVTVRKRVPEFPCSVFHRASGHKPEPGSIQLQVHSYDYSLTRKTQVVSGVTVAHPEYVVTDTMVSTPFE